MAPTSVVRHRPDVSPAESKLRRRAQRLSMADDSSPGEPPVPTSLPGISSIGFSADVAQAVRRVQRLPLPLLGELTPAERRVLVYVCAGYSNKEIATALGRAEPTIKHQVSACLRKMGQPSRARLIAALR